MDAGLLTELFRIRRNPFEFSNFFPETEPVLHFSLLTPNTNPEENSSSSPHLSILYYFILLSPFYFYILRTFFVFMEKKGNNHLSPSSSQSHPMSDSPASVFMFHSRDPKVEFENILTHICDEVLNIDRSFPRSIFSIAANHNSSPHHSSPRLERAARNQLRDFFSTAPRDKLILFVGHGAQIKPASSSNNQTQFAFFFDPQKDQDDQLTLEDLLELSIGTPTRRVYPFVFSCSDSKDSILPLRYLEPQQLSPLIPPSSSELPRLFLRHFLESRAQSLERLPTSNSSSFFLSSPSNLMVSRLEHILKTLELWQNRNWKAQWYLEPRHINFSEQRRTRAKKEEKEEEEEEEEGHDKMPFEMLSPVDLQVLRSLMGR
jgi:hypothetical protein